MKVIGICLANVVLLLAGGCAISQANEASSLRDINFAEKESNCGRGCLNTYSACAARSGDIPLVNVHANVVTACKEALRACVSTCPSR